MYIFAYALLLAAFLTSVFMAGGAALQLWQKECAILPLVEKGCCIITGLISASSMFLLAALVTGDFSLAYVARHSDKFLSLFYCLTAFWAGQEGSLLFWCWSATMFGLIFIFSKAYALLKAETKLWFWVFFMALIAFFLMLITAWHNPFILLELPPPDGNGLNPLLQHPGMILHPPLLFMGYAGFAIPSCMALAQTLSGGQTGEKTWIALTRPFITTAWVFLSAGIILGAWWAYMELDWNGYWGWDPVENASLLPWLIATAFLHTALAEARYGMFKRLNVLLMALTTILAFVATYITRSGIIQSLHAYADDGTGQPLLVFIAVFLAATLITGLGSGLKSAPLQNPASREGLLLMVSVLLLLLAFIILSATCLPLLSKIWSDFSVALLPAFYNRVCLPIFTLLALLLAFCPHIHQTHQIHQAHQVHQDKQPPGPYGQQSQNIKPFAIIAGIFILMIPIFWYLMEGTSGTATHPLAWVAASAAFTGIISIIFRCRKSSLTAQGVHLGLLLMVMGIAFSGPYQLAGAFTMSLGQEQKLGQRAITLKELYKGESAAYSYYKATLMVQGQKDLLRVERRKYHKYPQSFSKADAGFTLGDQVYASLLGFDEKTGKARIHLSINPKINWLWIGGVLLCLAPLVRILRKVKSNVAET